MLSLPHPIIHETRKSAASFVRSWVGGAEGATEVMLLDVRSTGAEPRQRVGSEFTSHHTGFRANELDIWPGMPKNAPFARLDTSSWVLYQQWSGVAQVSIARARPELGTTR